MPATFDISIFYDPTKVNAPILVPGPPPVDQTALVASLQAANASLTTANLSLSGQLVLMTADRDAQATLAGARRTALDGMIVDIQSANAADVAEDAADTAGDVARAAALLKGQNAP